MSFFKNIIFALFISILSLSPILVNAISPNIDKKNVLDLPTSASYFIADICNDALKTINTKNITENELYKKFDDILNAKFKIKSIARFALGPKFKLLKDNLKNEYISYFKNMLIKFYAHQFQEFKNAKIAIENSTFKDATKSQLISVKTKVAYKNKVILVEWLVEPVEPNNNCSTNKETPFLISDVKVDNISMKKVQREEITGLLKNKTIDAFMEIFKKDYQTLNV